MEAHCIALELKYQNHALKYGHSMVLTGKIFASCTSKADSEPTHGSNIDISKIHECKQTLNLSAGKSQSVVAEKADISETSVIVDSQQMKKKADSWKVSLFDEYVNGKNEVVSKSSAVTTTDASDKRQQQSDTRSSTSILATIVIADGNFDFLATEGFVKRFRITVGVAINTKFLNCLQPEWSKYVTMVRQNQFDKVISYDMLYASLVQFKPHVLASTAKKAAKNHDQLALIAHSNAYSSHLHANSSYSPQSYYVTHPSSIVDYNDEFKKCYNCNEKGHYARDCQNPKVFDAKYFREQMLLAMKDEAGSHLRNKNDFMLDNAYGEELLDELTASVMLMA
ncbi:putative ribonuclease H-like domain-containing protein [Tanacetum coccineum]|uniref:Ribonuclease H-like domain-containing protein n=1 Tax=Tanacetum coccineum TaxID=301880 RepID=A0ABQ5BF69_9ASTR